MKLLWLKNAKTNEKKMSYFFAVNEWRRGNIELYNSKVFQNIN